MGTLSPGLTSMGIRLPSLSNPPEPAASTVPSDNFSCDFSGMKIPLEVFYDQVGHAKIKYSVGFDSRNKDSVKKRTNCSNVPCSSELPKSATLLYG